MDRFDPEARILSSWQTNAEPWVTAVREARIESRRLVTDQAMLAAIAARKPRSVLDLGVAKAGCPGRCRTRVFAPGVWMRQQHW